MTSESHHTVIMTTLENVTYCKKQGTVFCDQIVEKTLYHLFQLYSHFYLHYSTYQEASAKVSFIAYYASTQTHSCNTQLPFLQWHVVIGLGGMALN